LAFIKTTNELQLIERCLTGDKRAFKELIEKYQKKVFTIIVRMVRNREIALELSQEVFIKVYKKLDNLKYKNRASSWIMQVAHHTTLDFIKKKRLESISTDFNDQATENKLSKFISTPSDKTPEQIIEKLSPSKVDDLLMELDLKYRTILVLRFAQGYSFKEISEILNLPLSTVKFRKHYAIKLLHKRWIEKHGK
jgi:RNA polymerase sigma-70 factor (ECF subfamily)